MSRIKCRLPVQTMREVKKMKQTIKCALLYVLLPVMLVTLPFAVQAFAAGDGTPYDWYFKPNGDHTQPEVLPEATFLKDFKNVLYLGPADVKVLYLTFDAGYDNGNTGKILDVLKEKNAPGAFFVDGNFVKSNPDLVKRIDAEGHLLGDHSLSHADMSSLSDFEKYKQQITGWEDLVKKAGTSPTKYFRFPCGRFSKRALEYNEKLGLKSVFWSFAYYDWDTNEQPGENAALAKMIERTHNGEILLLHAVSSTNAEILGEYIDKMRALGYRFGALTELA